MVLAGVFVTLATLLTSIDIAAFDKGSIGINIKS